MHHLSKLLRERRKSLGLSMTQVVQKAQFGSLKKGLRRLWELETGSPVYHIDLLNQFADALELAPDEVGSALEADREWEASIFRARFKDQNHFHTLIIQNREALVAHNPWTVVPFSTNALFGDRKNETCIGAMTLLWERAEDFKTRCDCGDRFYILSWVERPAGGQTNCFCPGCHTHQETFGRTGQDWFGTLKPCLDGTEFNMSRSRFPQAIRPRSGDILDALIAVGVEVNRSSW